MYINGGGWGFDFAYICNRELLIPFDMLMNTSAQNNEEQTIINPTEVLVV